MGVGTLIEFYFKLIICITIPEEPEFGRWTAARLAEHLEKETGIKLSGSQVRRILRRKKYVYIWAKYSLEDKQDKKLRKAFIAFPVRKRDIVDGEKFNQQRFHCATQV
ncbi:hypothetical protein myaer87_34310 [Microcystis aeruginosa NIES-87]|nr:hypothetical protein myaer87_34310 [Microcystis aeruginosa NIES-87]